jgi:quercetin dioxygenase-like cupin family protein
LAAQSPVLLDNESVRVVKAHNTPGQKSRMHRHTVNRVMVHLTAGHMRLTSDTGDARDIRFRAGEARWDPAGGLHTSENMGSGSYEIVEVELKKPDGAKINWPELDPLRVDPKHYSLEFENEQVRVTRGRASSFTSLR